MSRPIRRSAPAINAGSMADIAFLLLIFFLVTTTILNESGILVKLPPYDPEQQPIDIVSRNLLRVAVNADDLLLINGERAQLTDIRERVQAFVLNPRQRADLADSPRTALVSLLHDRSTHYATYLTVYNELRAAYREMWNERARQRFGAAFAELSNAQQRAIRREIPMVVSEADLVDYGQGG